MPGVTLCKTHTHIHKLTPKNKSIDSSEMRGLRRIASAIYEDKQKIVKNRRNNIMAPQKIDVVGKKHNNSLNHASKQKKESHTDTVSRLTKENKTKMNETNLK